MYGDYPQARRRRNHNMVEKGVHAVPTLRNRVVIFYFIVVSCDLKMLNSAMHSLSGHFYFCPGIYRSIL